MQASLHDAEYEAGQKAAMVAEPGTGDEDVASVLVQLEAEMQEAAENLEFERAALLRDQIKALRSGEFRKSLGASGPAGQRRSYARTGKGKPKAGGRR